MIYKYLMTSDVERDLNKCFPQDARIKKSIKKHIEDPTPLESSNDVEFICANLFKESDQTPSGPRYLWFKETRNDVCIYVLRKVYLHDEYLRKLNPAKRKSWVERHTYSEKELAELEDLFAVLSIEETREPLPEEYRIYEERPRRFEQNREVLVFELPEWIEGYSELDDRYKQGVFDELSNIIVSNGKIPQPDKYGFFHLYANGYDIVFRIEAGGNSTLAFYLLQLSKGTNLEALVELNYNCEEIRALRHKSSKCYPAFIAIDYDTWLAVEEDNQANLALSNEELTILQNIEYPFYVSGLAGSGKSTILYYLFAHIYDYVSHKHPEHNLLFLSYSRKLVSNAQSIVKSILQHHPSYNCKFIDKNHELAFSNCFQPFQEFIKREFLDNTEYDVFSREKYIDYQEFKKLYDSCQLPEKKRYSSDIVWSVIRTYIKGKNCEKPFTPEDYADVSLSEKDRTVTVDDYRQIFRIWESWYKKYYDKGDGWDDLDLVRYAMMKKDASKHFHKYAVVFCDEAQDFTKLETDLLLRLSVHSKYDLSQYEEDERIPIAFAGDPNQTINPTGFRWGSTQEIFTNSFKEALGKFSGMDAKPLKTNYRSREGIVKFANTIQYIRHQFLMGEKQKLSLQKAWDSEGDSLQNNDGLRYVAYFSIDKYHDRIAEGLQKAIVITADEGEYVMEEEVIDEAKQSTLKDSKEKSGLVKTRSNYTKERKAALGIANDVDNSRLYTPITAKGLEFKAAILYKFSSDSAMFLFEDMIIDGKVLEESDKFKLAHFFTKLYIAISRAKQVLFIVDTDESYEKFWKYFIEKELWERFIHQSLGNNKYISDLGKVSLGDISEYALRLEKNYRPKEYAETLYRSALEEGDRDIMDRARSAFKEAKYNDRAMLCEAYLCRYDHSYSESGKRFLKLNKTQEAIESFWEGKCWNELNEALQNFPVLTSKEETYRTICLFMTGKIDCDGFVRRWQDNEIAFQSNIADCANADLWNAILGKLKLEIGRIKTISITAELLKSLDYLSKYYEFYENGMADLRARLHFARAEFVNIGKEKLDKTDYEISVELWEHHTQKPSHKDYYKAKKLTCGSVSEKIVWMNLLGEIDEILKNYSEKRLATMLTEEAQNIVFAALVSSNYEEAINYPYPKDTRSKWQRLYSIDLYKFIVNVVLNDFTEEKFEYLADKVARGSSRLVLSKDVFDIIFALNGQDTNSHPYWKYFISDLNDLEGNRTLITEVNVSFALDALSERIISDENYDKAQATCFLEILFGDLYNLPRAEKFRNTIVHIFKSDVFFKEDFRNTTKRNKYFTDYAKTPDETVDLVKANVRKFVVSTIDSFKTIKKSAINDIKALFRAYEICAPYSGTMPDFTNSLSLYKKCSAKKKYESLRKWIEGRVAFLNYMDSFILQRASYNSFMAAIKQMDIDVSDVVADFSREDAASFITASFQDDIYNYDKTILAAKLIHHFRIRRDDFKTLTLANDLVKQINTDAEKALNEVTSGKINFNETSIKFLAFVWEAFFDHPEIAKKYSDLSDNVRRANLKDYLRRRALLHYSYGKQKLFESMQRKFNISMTKDYLPSRYPDIREKTKELENSTFTASKKYILSTQIEHNLDDHHESIEPNQDQSHPIDAAKEKALEIGKNAKNMGMPNEMIMQLTGLTKDEVEKL